MNSLSLVAIFITLALISFLFALRALKRRLNQTEPPLRIKDGVLLSIQVPKLNEKGPLAAEMMFSALHGMVENGEEVPHLSFEIVGTAGGIRFYVLTPLKLRGFVESQIYAQYPAAEISEVVDYVGVNVLEAKISATEVVLEREYYFPIKTFPDFEVDPLAAITSSMGDVSEGGQIWLQILVRPVPDIWQEPGFRYIEEQRTGVRKDTTPLFKTVSTGVLVSLVSFIGRIMQSIIQGPRDYTKLPPKEVLAPRLPPEKELEIKSIQQKLSFMGFETAIRIVGIGPDEEKAIASINSLVAALKQFSIAQLNSFVRSENVKNATEVIEDYKNRVLPVERENLFVLNTEELASVFHLPNISVETPNIAWTHAKKAEPPLLLPVDTYNKFAFTAFRDRKVTFGIKREDRRRHMYIIGKTGTGKSSLMKNMVINDLRKGEGLAILDPHGDLVDEVLDFIPDERIEDVVVFDPSDIEHPVALNMLELFDPDQRGLVASGLVDVFRARFAFSWGPRLEHLIRNCILTLLEVPSTTLLGITRILTDRAYERYIVHLLSDPVMIDFWNNEFREMRGNQRLVTEAIAPIQNRLGQFLSAPTIRNIVGQARSTIRLDEILNEGKILLVNLSKGKLGEDNSAILGGMLVSRLQFAAMTRASIPEEERRDFFVYADEFQNFATTNFATILSEARKYHLNLILAHQYIAQVPQEVQDAVFGNVGTMMTFVIGQQDAHVLAREFAPVFDENDLISLERYHVYLKLMVDLTQSRPFSAVTMPPYTEKTNNRERVLALSREKYSRPREAVEERVKKWSEKQFTPGMDDKEVERHRKELRAEAKKRMSEGGVDFTVENGRINQEVKGEIRL